MRPGRRLNEAALVPELVRRGGEKLLGWGGEERCPFERQILYKRDREPGLP